MHHIPFKPLQSFRQSTSWLKILILFINMTFLAPEFSWAFNPHTYSNALVNGLPSIDRRLGDVIGSHQPPQARAFLMVIQDMHAHPEAQSLIRRLVDRFIEQQDVRLVALEGSSGDLDSRPLSRLPYPDLKAGLLEFFAQAGQVAGAEMSACLAASNGVRLFGAENPAEYARALALAREFLTGRAQVRLQNLRFVYETLSDELAPESLSTLDELTEAFLDRKLSARDFAAGMLREAGIQPGQAPAWPGLNRLRDGAGESGREDPAETVARLWPEISALRARLCADAAQRELDVRQHDLDALERVLKVAAFSWDLEAFRSRPESFRIAGFLEFYNRQAVRLGLPEDRKSVV